MGGVLGGVVLLMAGCSGPAVVSRVLTMKEGVPAKGGGETFFVVGSGERRAPNRAQADYITGRLMEFGWKVAESRAAADYWVTDFAWLGKGRELRYSSGGAGGRNVPPLMQGLAPGERWTPAGLANASYAPRPANMEQRNMAFKSGTLLSNPMDEPVSQKVRVDYYEFSVTDRRSGAEGDEYKWLVSCEADGEGKEKPSARYIAECAMSAVFRDFPGKTGVVRKFDYPKEKQAVAGD